MENHIADIDAEGDAEGEEKERKHKKKKDKYIPKGDGKREIRKTQKEGEISGSWQA